MHFTIQLKSFFFLILLFLFLFCFVLLLFFTTCFLFYGDLIIFVLIIENFLLQFFQSFGLVFLKLLQPSLEPLKEQINFIPFSPKSTGEGNVGQIGIVFCM